MLSIFPPAAPMLLEAPPVSVILMAVVVLLLLIAGILKLWRILRRPAVNQLCVAALLLFTAAWVVSILNSFVQAVPALPRALHHLLSSMSILGILGTAVLAVAGLVHGSRNPGKYRQGRAQGIWALVLSGLFILGVGLVAVAGGIAGYRNSLAGRASGNGGFGGGAAEMSWKGKDEFKEFNFRLGDPGRPWVKLAKGKVVPTATAVYTRALPEAYLAVMAEDNEVGMSRDDLLAVAEGRLESSSKSVSPLLRETRKLGGITFLRATFKVEGVSGVPVPLCYDEWVACTAKRAYQFIFWSPLSGSAMLTSAAESWMATFELIEADPDAAADGFYKDSEVPAAGYATSLEPLEWKRSSPEAFDSADFVVHKGPDHLALVALALPALEGLRGQEVEETMLELLSVTEEEKGEGPREITHSGIPGREYRFERKLEDEEHLFRVRILRQERMVRMLSTWSPKGGNQEAVDKAVAAVRLFAPRDVPSGENPPVPERVLHAKSVILNSLGIALFHRQEFARAEPFFRAAAKDSPADGAIAANLADCLGERNLHQAALDFLKGCTASGPLAGSRKLLTRQAILLGQTGDTEEALKVWRELFGSGYESEDHLLVWINLLVGEERKEEALKALRDYAQAHPSPKLRGWEAGVLARMDKYDEAFAVLEPLVSGGKPDLEALYLKGEFENEAGKYEAAEKTAARLLNAGEDTPRTRMILGWSEWHRKSWKAARAAFEKAAEKAPNDAGIQEALGMTRGAMGQGRAELSQTPIEAVAVPENLRQALNGHAAPAEDFSKGHGAVQQERITGYYFEAGKPAKVTQYYKVKVLDSAGVEAFSTLSLTFYPASERVHVNRLTVRDESGAVVQEGNQADAYSSGESGEIVSGAEVLRVPVPGLRRGCTLEAVITVEDKGRSTKPPFHRDLLISGFPTVARAWFLSGDTAAVKVLTAPGLTLLDSGKAKAAASFDLPAVRVETFSAPFEDWQPWVIAGPSDADWKAPSQDYLKRLTDRLKPDASTEKVYKEITKGLSSPAEKLSAIIRHVQSTLTYKGLEFGTRALIPSAVSKIQADHYGDCKDHSLLLYHLLRRAGIACHPALVDTGWKIRQDIASLDQFDHMILYVPGISRNPWIDATEDGLDLTRFFPSGLAGREALILDPERPRFEKIPDAAASEIHVERMVSLRPDQGIEVIEDLRLEGESASWARAWFMDSPRGEHPALVRRQWDGYGNVEISEVTLSALEDVTKPMGVHLKYTVSDAMDPATRQLSLPFFWERDYLTVNPVDDRRAPLEINPTMKVESLTRLSPEWRGAVLPGSLPAEGETIGGDWSLEEEKETKDLEIRLRVNAGQGKYAAKEWSAFQQGRRALIDKLKRPLLTVPKPM